jgi:Ca2+-binding EF-hand superfamily protein
LLRRNTSERYAYRVGRYDNLPRGVERELANLLELELSQQRKKDVLRLELEARYDYSTYSAFKGVDKYNDGHITTFNLGLFLRNNGHFAQERELLAIIRRIDTDGDAKISYSEFCDFIRGDS